MVCSEFLRDDLYYQEKIKFRSPDFGHDNLAYNVIPDGEVGIGWRVTDGSYGRSSPDFGYYGDGYHAYWVHPDGNVYSSDWNVSGSCGRSSPGTVTTVGSWYISPAGIHIAGTLEGNSYGHF